MYHLYDGNEGYSQEALLRERQHHGIWSIVRNQVEKTLAGVLYDEDAKAAFQRLPFELWTAANSFGDEFSVLYLKLPASELARTLRDAERAGGREKYRRIAEAMEAKGQKVRFISIDLLEGACEDVETPDFKSTSTSVVLALENLNTLLQNSNHGPTSAVDRIHTALHAHLIHLCETSGLTPDKNADLTSLFSLLRRNRAEAPSDVICRALARIIHALNPVRNESSLAHPSEALLEEPEAMLVLNAGRTLLRYIDSRFSTNS